MSGVVLVTGATGPLGRGIVEGLLTRLPANRIAAMCRTVSHAADLAARGVDVRRGDYHDQASLTEALAGVDKLMLVSAPAFTDAITSHHNVIAAAQRARVEHVHFASIQRAPDSTFSISQVTEWNEAAEEELKRSGLAATILRNTLYADALDALIGEPDERGGLRIPAGHGRAAVANRADIAEATAAVLAGDGHAGRTHDLAGSHPITLSETAAVIATAYRRPVTYQSVSVEEFVAERAGQGVSDAGLRFQADWFGAVAAGEFAATGMIEDLLGRPPTDPLSYISQRRGGARTSD